MTSFQDLGLGPELTEGLAARGIERPSAFQADAVPVVRRGNNLIGRAGPGAGTLVAYGAPLLDRLAAGEGRTGALVLAPTRERAAELARSLGDLARVTGHSVAALGGRWALPERADVLFATPADALGAVEGSRIKLDSVEAFVVDGAAAIRELVGFAAVETLAEFVPAEAQRVLFSLPLPEELDDFAEGHLKRAVRVPPGREGPSDADDVPHRGTLGYRVTEDDRIEALLSAVGSLLDGGGARHVLVHFHSDDEAADVGDELTLHGYEAGAPGDASVPVWLGSEARSSRKLLDELEGVGAVATLSYRVPLDPDDLDRRHARGGSALTLARARELPHLEQTAAIAGYALEARGEAGPSALSEEVSAFRRRLERAVETADLASYSVLLEPLARRHGTAKVAAAATALLRERGAAGEKPAAATPAPEGGRAEERGWVRLFMSVGQRDDAGPGDVLGAITGEAGVDGSRVGRIDIRDTFSLVEVEPGIADRIIEAVNGTTVKGRSVRVDFDRSRGRRARRGGGSDRH